jgi:hypothetical protein
MAIRFRCHHCNQLLGIANRKAGSAVRCPKCSGEVLVPGPEGASVIPTAALALPATSARPAGEGGPGPAAEPEESTVVVALDEEPRRGFRFPRLLADALAGSALAVALLLVFVIDRLAAPTRAENTLPVRVVADSSVQAAPARKLRLAVTPTYREPVNLTFVPWDDMGKLLRELGDGYRFDEVTPLQMLTDPHVLDPYDVLFLTCAPGGQELKDVLAQYVSRGGTLYASDWRFDAVAAAFPEFVDADVLGSGVREVVTAEVVDPALRELVGPTIPLRFNLPRWKTAAFGGPRVGGPRVSVLLRGAYHRQRHPRDRVGDPATAPLLVKFSFGKGMVIFTSFHNEKQNSELERKLLQYLVFSLVTADVNAQVTASIQGAGFAPQKSNLLSTPPDNPSVSRTYTNSKTGPLRFALGFRNEGAEFRLLLRSPDGRTYTWEGTSTVILEVPDALPGEWTYTVTAVRLPYENFPFTVTVSEKQ